MNAREEVLARLHDLGLVAVLRGPSRELTIKMVNALVEGGVRGIEITFSTPEAAHLVQDLSRIHGQNITVGMGTLTGPAHAEQALQAGASFIVSPHCEEALASAMEATGLVVMMGAMTPSEIIRSRQLGSDVVKLFPGSQLGPSYLRALRGPYPDLPIMPTGGVTPENLADWFAAGAFAVGAGGALCPRSWAEEGRFKEISERAEQFVEQVRQARLAASTAKIKK